MHRRRRLILWLLILAFTVPLPLGGALAAGACAHEGMAAADEAAVEHAHHHAMHAMTAESPAESAHDCCHDAAGVVDSSMPCDGSSCSGCAVTCHIVSTLPNTPISLSDERRTRAPDTALESVQHIYPQVPHQPPRV